MVRVIEGKIIIENELRGNENWFESEREFELSRVRVTEGKITVMQGKSILVRVSEGSSYLESTVFRDDLVKVWRRWIVGDYEWNAIATFLL